MRGQGLEPCGPNEDPIVIQYRPMSLPGTEEKSLFLFQWGKFGRQSGGVTVVPAEGSTLGVMAVAG